MNLSEAVQQYDMCQTCDYVMDMSKTIQIRNVPDSLDRRLKSKAALELALPVRIPAQGDRASCGASQSEGTGGEAGRQGASQV